MPNATTHRTATLLLTPVAAVGSSALAGSVLVGLGAGLGVLTSLAINPDLDLEELRQPKVLPQKVFHFVWMSPSAITVPGQCWGFIGGWISGLVVSDTVHWCMDVVLKGN